MLTLREFKHYKKGFSWALLMLILTIATADVAMASPTSVLVDPPIIIDPDMVPGTQFSVDITVDYVEKLAGYQFHLLVDPTVLHVVSVENGDFLASAGGIPEFYPGEGFEDDPEDPNYGWLYLVVGALPPPPATPPPKFPSGGGVLATVTFEVVGTGTSSLTLGPQTGLINMGGGYQLGDEWCYGLYPVEEYPGGPIIWVLDHPLAIAWRESLGHGFFSNMPGPELYVRTRGAHGTSGSWPEWTVGSTGDTQTLYCRIMNYGFMGADVKVEFRVRCDGGEFTPWMSDEAWVDPAIAKGDPSAVTVSASFTVDAEGQYRVCVILYFKAGGMANFVPYFMVEEALGGVGISRDIPVSFKC